MRSLRGQQSQEGHLNGSSVGGQVVITIAELHVGREDKKTTMLSVNVNVKRRGRCVLARIISQKSGATHVESSIHCLSKPDVFAVLALAGPPVLPGNAGRLGVDAGLPCLHVAENLDCINGAALIGIDPVLSCRKKSREISLHDDVFTPEINSK